MIKNVIVPLSGKGYAKTAINSIGFWISVFFLVRLIGITNPPLEFMHNWRQVTGLMVARNFLQIDSNFLYPRIDDLQKGNGIIGMEFPLLNYLHFLLSKLFSYTHWYGRLINLVVTSIGMYYYYRILLFFFNKQTAFWSTIFLICSIWFCFSRKFMPDTFAASLVIIGTYYGILFFEKSRYRYLIMYMTFVSAGLLSKIPYILYLPIFIPFMLGKYPKTLKSAFLLCSTIPVSLTFLWYFLWNPHLESQFGNFYNTGYSLGHGFKDLLVNWQKVSIRFIYHAFYGVIVFSFFAIGLFLLIKKQTSKLIYAFLLFFPLFFVFMCKSGYLFYQHNYYVIPIVPVMSLIAAYGILHIQSKLLFTILIIAGLSESLYNQHKDFFIPDTEKYKLSLYSIANKISFDKDSIVINGNGVPQHIYFTNRKGWTAFDDEITDTLFLNKIAKQGCRYIFVDRTTLKDSIYKRVVFIDDKFIVYDMQE